MRRILLVAFLLAAPLAFAGEGSVTFQNRVECDAIDREALEGLRVRVEAHRAAGVALEARLAEVLGAIAKKHGVPLDRLRVDLAAGVLTIAPVESGVAAVTTRGR